MKRVFAHIGFSSAITLIVLNFFQINTAFVILAVTGAAFAVSLIIKRTRKGIAVPLCMISAAVACILFITNYYGSFIPQSRLNGNSATAEFYIVDLEEQSSYGYNYTVKTRRINMENVPQNIKLHLKSRSKIDADYYQILKGSMKFSAVSDNGYTSYGSFGKGIYLSASAGEIVKTDESVFSLNKQMLRLRQHLIDFVLENVEGESAGLIIALTTGNKSYLSNEIIDNFKTGGAMHVMAVSGLHLAVFSGSVYLLLKKLRVPKLPLIVVSVSSIVFYASLAGFSKSIMRAGIMMAVLMAGRLFQEKSDALNSLGFAVFIICLNPYSVTDAGAMLTVTAVLGLIAVNPHIKRFYTPNNFIIKYFYNILTASVSVFITTLPVMYFVFGYISIYGIFLNMIMLPLAQLTLACSLLLLISFGPLVSLFSLASDILASFMIETAAYFAELPFAVMGITGSEFGLAIGVTFLLFAAAFLMNKKHILRKCAVLSAVVFLLIISVSYFMNYDSVYVREISGRNSKAVIVYNRENAAVFGVIDSVQFSAAGNILKSKNLDLLLIVNINKNDYSEKLAQEYHAVNYVSDIKNINSAVNSNIFTDSYFNVDLWQGFHVEYNFSDNGSIIELKVFDTDFLYTDNKNIYNNKSAVYLNHNSDYDLIYTVDRSGYTEWRLNRWLK